MTTCKDCQTDFTGSGVGRPPTRCPECRVKAEAAQNRARVSHHKRRERVKNGEIVMVEDDDDAPVIDPINIELGHMRVELVYDPLPVEEGGFRPGAKFHTDHVITCGRGFDKATVQSWVAPGMMFEVHPYGKEPNRYQVSDDFRMEKVG